MGSDRLNTALFAVALSAAALWPALRGGSGAAPLPQNAVVEWAEAEWVPQDGAPRRLRLSAREQRFASQFPGRIARFADDRHEWIVRVVNQPTRMLHPAADCFRGLGYTVTPPRVRIDARNQQWRCFTAGGKGKPLQVCERIFDARGGRWTDASSWYWSALVARGNDTAGPWWAVTRVEAGE